MKVLLAVDEPDYAKAVTDSVVNHTWPQGTEFIIFCAIEPMKVGNMMAFLPGPMVDEVKGKKLAAATTSVQETKATLTKAFPNQSVQEVVAEGFPKDEIIKYAIDNKVDLIAMGSHGRTGVNRMILGSVSMAVVSHAPCSVWVIRL